jgi:hypothetical protein
MTRKSRRELERELGDLDAGDDDGLAPAEEAVREAIREASADDPVWSPPAAAADCALVTVHRDTPAGAEVPETHVLAVEMSSRRWYLAPEYIPDAHAEALPVTLPDPPVPVVDFTGTNT